MTDAEAKELREHYDAAIRQERERCARLCDIMATGLDKYDAPLSASVCRHCRDEIRRTGD